MIAKEGIQMLQLMYLRMVFRNFKPIANDIGRANERALAIIDMTNANNYARTMEVSKQYLTTLVSIGSMAKIVLDGLDSTDKLK